MDIMQEPNGAKRLNEEHQTMEQELKTLEYAQGNMALEWDSGILLSHPKLPPDYQAPYLGPHISWQPIAFELVILAR